MDIWPMQLHRTQHLEARELMLCSGHLGILNNLSLGGPRVPFFTWPSKLCSLSCSYFSLKFLFCLAPSQFWLSSHSPALFPHEFHCQDLVFVFKLILNADQICITSSASGIKFSVDSCGKMEHCSTIAFST